MSQILLFSREKEFNEAIGELETIFKDVDIINPPPFCHGLMAPAAAIPSWNRTDKDKLESSSVKYAGAIGNREFGREIPAFGEPDPRVFSAIGWISLESAANSVSDPYRLRLEFSCAKGLDALIPVMARLISGGAFNPAAPSLAIEEGHRLIVISGRKIVLSRVDDLLDAWIILRTTVDFITLANERYKEIKPETRTRRGLGASEIYKRLPADDCGQCGREGCMEFATELLMGRLTIDDCPPLKNDEMERNLKSLKWLMEALGPSD